VSGNDQEQFVEHTEYWPTAPSLQNHELLAKGQIFEQDFMAGAEKTQKQTEEESQRRDNARSRSLFGLRKTTLYLDEITDEQNYTEGPHLINRELD